MLRLAARVSPLTAAYRRRLWATIPRAYASSEAPASGSAAANLQSILQEFTDASKVQPRSTIGTQPKGTQAVELDEEIEEDEGPKGLPLHVIMNPLNNPEVLDSKFGDEQFTTRTHGLIREMFPALQHEVDVEKLHAKLKYDDVYLQDHTYEPKTVFKFKNLVTKNYRTISRSWPMVRLNYLKYGNEHFLDELYDNIPGKYRWNNRMAFPDGSINLYCGTNSKGSPLSVKGDPVALTYDDALYKMNTHRAVQKRMSKQEADTQFPNRQKETILPDEEQDVPYVRPPPPEPIPEFETEAQEDARHVAEREGLQKNLREFIADRMATDAEQFDKIVVSEVDETIEARAKRWAWETKEDLRRPWRTLENRGIQKWDDRVVYDPVTMVRLVHYTERGRMVERYYYRDEVTANNAYIVNPGEDVENDPDFDYEKGVLALREMDDSAKYTLETSPKPPRHPTEPYYPHDTRTKETVTAKIVSDVLPKLEKAPKESKVEYKQKELRKDLLDDGVLPASTREQMIATFNELVQEKVLKEEDKWTYYNEFVRLTAKAFSKATAEEYYQNTSAGKAGRTEVKPTYYFKYIKINLGEGWIRFYVGEQDHAERGEMTEEAIDIMSRSEKESNAMKLPFVWKFSEYKLSPEDVESMKKVKWPPSLTPPPTDLFQEGDGSPQDQLAKYFEQTYLRFGHDVRFNPQDCFDPKYDFLPDPQLKYAMAVGSNSNDVEFVPNPGEIDLSARTDLTPEEREKEDKRLRNVIRRDAAEAMYREHLSFADRAMDARMQSDLVQSNIEQIEDHLNNVPSQYHEPALPKVDDEPHRNVKTPSVSRFKQNRDSVLAYDENGQFVIQEFVGYRLRVANGNRIRITRIPSFLGAKVLYYDANGAVTQEEDHSFPPVDFSYTQAKIRDRHGRSSWAYVSNSYQDIAVTKGLPTKRAVGIEEAEQDKAEGLRDLLRELGGDEDLEPAKMRSRRKDEEDEEDDAEDEIGVHRPL